MTDQFLNDASVISSSFGDAMSSQISGMANLTAQAALDRIRTATALAKQVSAGSIDLSA